MRDVKRSEVLVNFVNLYILSRLSYSWEEVFVPCLAPLLKSAAVAALGNRFLSFMSA